MWKCRALLVSCVLAVVLGDTIFDTARKYIARIRGISATEAPYRKPVSKPPVNKNVTRSEVKSVVPDKGVSQDVRGTRNTLYPIEGAQFHDNVGQIATGLHVESSRLNIKAPLSRKYYNPALKKTPFPFGFPIEEPYPFQTTAFGALYPLEAPTGSGLQLGDGLLQTTAGDLPPTAIASLPPTSIDFSSPDFVADSWRSFQHIPVSVPSAPPNFSTRPPWIPRGGMSDFQPQRGNLPTSAPGNQVPTGNNKRPTVTAGSVSDLIKQVEQLIIASSQNSTNATSTNNTTTPNFRRFFKHPSVG